MPLELPARVLRLIAPLFLSLGFTSETIAAPAELTCCPAVLPIEGHRIWARAQGSGPVTVVFEAGFGNDSTVWDSAEPRIRAMGLRTLIYDRAGMGRSSIDTQEPYSLNHDVRILLDVMARCGVDTPVVFVVHSYGGAIGLVAATQDRRFRGLVLLDALVPGVLTDHEVDKSLKTMRAQYDAIRKQAPGLAKVAIPWAEATPRTARQLNKLIIPEDLPIIEVVAEKGQSDPDSAATWLSAQKRFTEGHPFRTFILAKGSSHKIMADKPDLVVEAITTIVSQVRPRW